MIGVESIVEARNRDLGDTVVGRVLPTLRHRFLGPFAFLDHMSTDRAIAVRPHPHLHLATVTYLFEGEIVHRDSLGSHQHILPGAINWMHAGRGIVHSERGVPGRMSGLQMWVALPRASEDTAPFFQHHAAESLSDLQLGGAHLRVLVGSAFGVVSKVPAASPLFYVDAELDAGATVAVPNGFAERGAYVVSGAISVQGQRIEARRLAFFAPGAALELRAEEPSRVALLGGEPLDGPRYIWWNFVSSSKERIVEATRAWREGKFPKVPGDEAEFIPAPDGPVFLAPAEHPHHENPSDDELRRILSDARTIAVVGASAKPGKPSHGVVKRLVEWGYRVIPVNPNEREVLGLKSFPTLSAIGEPVDVVDVFRRAEYTEQIAEDAVCAGAKVLWLQLGIANEAAAARAREGGLTVVMDKCIAVAHAFLGVPSR